MLELYYFHDATCGIKARMALFEKGVEFTPRVLDRYELATPEYLAINPKGLVPTLVHDGEILYESTVICLYVDDAFDGPALKPAAALDRARMYTWLKDIDEQYFKGIGSTTFALALRKQILDKYPTAGKLEAYFASIRIDEYRQRRRSIVAKGVEAPEAQAGIRALDDMLHRLEAELSRSPFAAGPDYTLADACLTPFTMRLEILGLENMWAKRPNVARWWQAIKDRDSYRRLLEESFPEEYVVRMRSLAGDAWSQVRPILEASDTSGQGLAPAVRP